MKSIGILGTVAFLATLPSALGAQSVAIHHDRSANKITVAVDTVPTQQFRLTGSADLTAWANLAFVDRATTLDLGPPAADPLFFKLDPLYGQLAWSATSNMPVARDQFTGGVIDGKLYLFGGNGDPDGVNLSRLDIYDLTSGEWTRGADYDFAFEELSSAVVGGKLYVFGAVGARVNLCYDPAVDHWSQTAPKPTQIQAATVVAWANEILVLGGSRGEESSAVTAVEAYNTTSNTWRLVTDLPDPAFMFGAGIHENVLYLVGGLNEESFAPQNRVLRFDLVDGIWLPEIVGILPRPILAPYSASCPIVNGKLIVAGGFTTLDGGFTAINESNFTRTDLVSVYDIASNVLSFNTPLPEAFGDHLFLLAEDKIFALGGKLGPLDDSEVRSSRMVIGTFDK